MVAIQNSPFDADHPRPRQDPGGGLCHIADVLDELLQRYPLPGAEAEELDDLEIEESVAV